MGDSSIIGAINLIGRINDERYALILIVNSWYMIARNIAGYPLDEESMRGLGVLEGVIFYLTECPGEPNGHSISSLLGKHYAVKFLDLALRAGLRPAASNSLPPDSLAHLFLVAGALAESELMGDTRAPIYRLSLIEDVIEAVASKLKQLDDYCSNLLGNILEALIDADKEVLESD